MVIRPDRWSTTPVILKTSVEAELLSGQSFLKISQAIAKVNLGKLTIFSM